MTDGCLPGEFVIGKLGPEQMFIFAEDSTIAARIDDDGTVRLARETVAQVRGGSSKMTCAEAAKKFRRWSERSGYAIDAAKLIAQAQVLEAFPGDTPVPQKLLDGWNLDD